MEKPICRRLRPATCVIFVFRRGAFAQPVSHGHAVPGVRVSYQPSATDPERDCFVGLLALPMSSDPLYQAPSREVCEAAEQSNTSVLGFLLREVDLEAMPRSADERLAAALAPIRIKLDMLIDMTARFSYREVALPPLCEVELGPTRIAWGTNQHWECGDWARISLYFHPTFREPVYLFAKVTDCIKQTREKGWRVEASLSEMLGHTGERLARLALLTCRRQQTRQRLSNLQ